MPGLANATAGNYLTMKIGTTEITEIESLTGGTATSNIIEFFNYNSRYSRKVIGSASTDAFELTLTYNPSNTGYIALVKAFEDSKAVAFTILLKDGPTGTGGTQLAFSGYVGSKGVSTEFDTQRTCSFTITVDGGITETAVATSST